MKTDVISRHEDVNFDYTTHCNGRKHLKSGKIGRNKHEKLKNSGKKKRLGL